MIRLMTLPSIFILADTITPFMFITGIRLIIANIVIAYIESLILRVFLKVRRRSLFGWMVLANYFSAVIGGLLLLSLGYLLRFAFSPIIFYLKSFLLSMFLVAFVLSFILELPFVFAAARPQNYSRSHLLFACMAAQIVSYALLFPLYWFTIYSAIQYNSDISPIKSLDFVACKAATVLFVTPDYSSVVQTRLDGSHAGIVSHVENYNLKDLSIRKGENGDRWDLWSTPRWNETNPAETDAKLVRRGISGQYPDYIAAGDEANCIDWRAATERHWKVNAFSNAFSPRLGMKAHNVSTGDSFQIKLNTAFISWIERCPNILPGDQVVFEISGQIVVLDLNTRKLGFIAYGHSPIVISTGEDGDVAAIKSSSTVNKGG